MVLKEMKYNLHYSNTFMMPFFLQLKVRYLLYILAYLKSYYTVLLILQVAVSILRVITVFKHVQ